MGKLTIINFKEKEQGWTKLQFALQNFYTDENIIFEDEMELIEMYCPSDLRIGTENKQRNCCEDCIECWNKCLSNEDIEIYRENVI